MQKVMQEKKLKVLVVASEMYPYAKTGGLGDFVSSLPKHLSEGGVEARVVIPRYRFLSLEGIKLKERLSSIGVWMGDMLEWGRVWEIESEVKIYLVEHNIYFGREGLYHDRELNDYRDNARRFGFLSRAAIQLCKDIGFEADIIHANDWQTALIPYYIKTWDFADEVVGSSASVLTIHNIAYQGKYPSDYMGYLGIRGEHFVEDEFEDFGALNLLKGGIKYADVVNTVSSVYADEIRSPYGGYGLSPYLSNRAKDFVGILNGVDYTEWDPKKDKHIKYNYGPDDLAGKGKNKLELQKYFGLKEASDIPILGIIGRFAQQKGYNLLVGCIRQILTNMRVQFVILGSGDKMLEVFFKSLESSNGGQIGVEIGYNEGLAHLIEAGSDFFVMPSLYEPCGLNQLYSLKYGTLPIVRGTGGLEETVLNYEEGRGIGNGFKFYEADSKALYYTIGWAVSTYYDRKSELKKLIKNAMLEDYSWERSAKRYISLYEQAIKNKEEYNKLFN